VEVAFLLEMKLNVLRIIVFFHITEKSVLKKGGGEVVSSFYAQALYGVMWV